MILMKSHNSDFYHVYYCNYCFLASWIAWATYSGAGIARSSPGGYHSLCVNLMPSTVVGVANRKLALSTWADQLVQFLGASDLTHLLNLLGFWPVHVISMLVTGNLPTSNSTEWRKSPTDGFHLDSNARPSAHITSKIDIDRIRLKIC